jgi:NOL1/NOP2/fmu family ribosome biogenesis protein
MQASEIKFFSRKEKERIEKLIEKNYGAKLDLSDVILAKTSNEKVWILSKDVGKLDISKLKVISVGLYLGRLKANEKILLSIEGCQLVGKQAERNIAILNEVEAGKFIQGQDVEVEKSVDCEERNFVLVKYKNDFLGSGKFVNNKVENLVSKSRRLLI